MWPHVQFKMSWFCILYLSLCNSFSFMWPLKSSGIVLQSLVRTHFSQTLNPKLGVSQHDPYRILKSNPAVSFGSSFLKYVGDRQQYQMFSSCTHYLLEFGAFTDLDSDPNPHQPPYPRCLFPKICILINGPNEGLSHKP